jgi:hypothetical protein
MKRISAALVIFGVTTLAQAATYTYTGKPYSTGTITNFTACAVGLEPGGDCELRLSMQSALRFNLPMRHRCYAYAPKHQ